MKAFLSVTAVAASMLAAMPASAAVIGFDDIISYEGSTGISNGYAGLNWQNFHVIHRTYHPDSGYDHGTVSGDYVAYNAHANPASISAINGTFSFDGAWFTAAWISSLAIQIEGFTDDDDVADYSATFIVNDMTPLFFEAGWSGLQRLTFTATEPGTPYRDWFAMDDLRINEGPRTEVPEPLTIGLLGMGLLGVAGARRRKG